MRVRRRPERILTDLMMTWSKTATSPMGTKIFIRTPSGAVVVLRRVNGRAAEAMGTRDKSRLRWRR